MINAFDPRYMETHEPEFMKAFRTHEANRQASATLSKYVERRRKTVPTHGTLFGISKAPVPAHLARPKDMLKPREFHVFQRAKSRSEIMSEIVAKKRETDKNYGTVNRDGKNIPKKAPHEKKVSAKANTN